MATTKTETPEIDELSAEIAALKAQEEADNATATPAEQAAAKASEVGGPSGPDDGDGVGFVPPAPTGGLGLHTAETPPEAHTSPVEPPKEELKAFVPPVLDNPRIEGTGPDAVLFLDEVAYPLRNRNGYMHTDAGGKFGFIARLKENGRLMEYVRVFNHDNSCRVENLLLAAGLEKDVFMGEGTQVIV